MPKKKKENSNENTTENNVKPVDLELVPATMTWPKNDLQRLRIESATKNRPMAQILRDLLSKHFEEENGAYPEEEKRRDYIEEVFPKIFESCSSWLSGTFNIDKFIDKMTDESIDLNELSAKEWRSVLEKLDDIAKDELPTKRVLVEKFLPLNPTRNQVQDLRRLSL
jgi:hypothetical protein